MKFIINRTDALGDTVLTMPMAQFIKERFPNSEVVFVTNELCSPLFKNHQYIDDIILFPRKSNLIKKLITIWQEFKHAGGDNYIYVGGSHLVSFIAWLKRIPNRGGLKSRWPSFFFLNKGVRQRRSNVEMHEVDYNLQLIKPFVTSLDFQDHEVRACGLSLTEDEKKSSNSNLNELLRQSNLDETRPYIVLHPGMTGHTLNWSSRNYGRLLKRLVDQYAEKFNYIVSYTPSDNRFLTSLRDEIDGANLPVLFYDGSVLGLRSFMGVLENAEIVIAPSTGPLHIANALGTKVVGIYSPIKVQSALRWGPMNLRHNDIRIQYPQVVCGEINKCAGHACTYYECMAKIEVDDVLNDVKSLLSTQA